MTSWLRRIMILFFLFSITISAGTISGTITSDTTWTLASSPITVTSTVTVLNGVTLTIETGVVVKFDTTTSLIVAGKIIADGVQFTSTKPVLNEERTRNRKTKTTISSSSEYAAPGDWNGIEFQNTVDVGSVFTNNEVYYAGGGSNASNIFYKTGAFGIPIYYTDIGYSLQHGINTRALFPVIHGCYIIYNNGFGVYSDLFSNFSIDSSNIYYNNNGGVRISTNSTPTVKNSYIEYNGIGVFIDNGASPIIQNNNIRYNNTGIQFTGVGANQPDISLNSIAYNDTWGLLNTSTTTTVKAENNYWGANNGPYNSISNPTGSGNRVSANIDFVPWLTSTGPLPVTNVSANITTPTVWSSGVYLIKANVVMSSTLTIMPGVIVKFESARFMQITGTLNAVGTSDSLIVFTSDKDDSYGGDSNLDGAATQPAAGNWSRLEINGAPASSSVLRNCVLQYGGSSSFGNIRIENSSPTISNIFSTNSSSYGVYINNSTVLLDSIVTNGNSSNGIHHLGGTLTLRNSLVEGNNGRGIFSNGTARMFVALSKILSNGQNGIQADGTTATVDVLDSSVVSFNKDHGIYNHNATGPQRFSYNRIEGNTNVGLWVYNTNDTILFLADTVHANGQEGIVSSKAKYLANVISNNSYPIGLIGRLSSEYSGNTITGNKFNNALALRLSREQFSDTLRATLPAGITSKTYVLIENGNSGGIAAGTTLVIEPGVIMKFGLGMWLDVSGTLIANGTTSDPIVFTSLRDSLYGGKTIALNDYSPPAPGNWYYVEFSGSATNSQMSHCIVRFAGQGGYSGIRIINQTMANPFTNITIRKSGYFGMYLDRVNHVYEYLTVDSNSHYGIYLTGTSPISDVTIRYSAIRYNNNHGLYAEGNSAFREVTNCNISNNNGSGIYISNGTIPQTFYGNTVSSNQNGIVTFSPNIATNDLQFIGNTITNNSQDGVISTASRFIDNTFQQNRYPITTTGKLGNTYVDNSNVDGNIFSQNTFNNAIGLYGNIYDTLKNVFPQSFLSKAYHVISSTSVQSGKVLIIDPGVNLKFQKPVSGGYDFELVGQLFANGTNVNPITFTSWRDTSAGGKTTTLNDTLPPLPGDWSRIIFRSGSNGSIVRFCRFLYGGSNGSEAVQFDNNVGGMIFSNNVVKHSATNGMYVYSSSLTIDSTLVENNAYSGFRIYDNSNNNIQIRYSTFKNNGQYGVVKENAGKLNLFLHSTSSFNGLSGLFISNNTVPLTVANSILSNNSQNGAVITATNNAIDTLILLINNSIRNNAQTGVVSSRAYFIGDTIAGNQIAIGVTGQLSLVGTGNVGGNLYDDNFIFNNMYEGSISVEGTIEGILGQNFPDGYLSKVFVSKNSLTVASGKSLNIYPGTILKFFTNNHGLLINGFLTAIGESNKKIVLTSFRDDLYGGDSNFDSTATFPAPGDWDRLTLNGAQNNSTVLRNVILRYGGYFGASNLSINGNNAVIDSSSVSYSADEGIEISNANTILTANEIHHNMNYGIIVYSGSQPIVNNNNFYDNLGAIHSYYTGTTFDAKNNYYNHSTGPLKNQGANQNLTGLGQRILVSGSGDVDYQPYLTARQGILFGDVSGNGQISAFDGSLVLQHLVEIISLTSTQQIAANVSGDSTVSALDASYILRYVVGLISGFPGFGKQSLESDILSAFSFRIEKNTNPDEFDLIVHLNRPTNVYGLNFKLTFDSTLVQSIGMKKTLESDSMSMVYHFPSGKANVAMAGITPLHSKGDIVRFSFKLLDPAKAKDQVLFTVHKFVINELDLTSDVGSIVLNVKDVAEIPTTFALFQNYPNPFNPTTTITYQIPVAGEVALTIYNMLGQEIKTLVSAQQSPGIYNVQWNGTDLSNKQIASGIYIYRISVRDKGKETFSSIKKMLLIK